VSFAARPLHIGELKEAVAFNQLDVVWDAGKIPQADVVIGCCANLVAVDPSDYCVRFAHPSVRTYLQKDSASFIPGYPKSDKQGELQCGEFCVAYLSFSNFNLEMAKPANETAAVKAPDPKLLAGDALASPLARLFCGRSADLKHPAHIQFREIRSAIVPDRSQYKFLDYATTHWALQTKKITSLSPIWEKFKQLSLCFNETWNFHPWVVGGRSQLSRLQGLFGWAVKKGHIPLLEVVLDFGRDLERICNLPLIGERLPALHVASRFGLAEVVHLLLPICQLNLQDEEGYTALHHAASKGHGDVVAVLLISQSTRVDVPSKTQVTPLWLAASHGHRDVVRFLAEKQANIEVRESSTLRTPLSQAAGNCHHAVVDFLVDKGAKLDSEDAEGRTPLSRAVANGHSDTATLLLDKGAHPDPAIPLFACAVEAHLHRSRRQYMHASLDTQCQCNLMSSRVWDRLVDGQQLQLEPCTSVVFDLDSAPICVQGIARDVNWQLLHYPHTYVNDFLVIEMESFDLIIGSETISRENLLTSGDDLSFRRSRVPTDSGSAKKEIFALRFVRAFFGTSRR
jgi:hypothetical protein